jgi:hypothetical protein
VPCRSPFQRYFIEKHKIESVSGWINHNGSAEESPIRTYRDILGAEYEATLLKHISALHQQIAKAD